MQLFRISVTNYVSQLLRKQLTEHELLNDDTKAPGDDFGLNDLL